MGMNIGLLYLSLHNLLLKKIGVGREVTRKEISRILGQHFLVPKNVRECVLKEMTSMKLVERLDKNNYKVLEYDLNIEEDVEKFYRTLKLFT